MCDWEFAFETTPVNCAVGGPQNTFWEGFNRPAINIHGPWIKSMNEGPHPRFKYLKAIKQADQLSNVPMELPSRQDFWTLLKPGDRMGRAAPCSLTCFSSHLGSVSLSAMGMLLLKQEDNQSASSSTDHLSTCKQVHPDHLLGQEMTQAGGLCWLWLPNTFLLSHL